MRIAYLSQMADVSYENGITKKIRSQISTWMEYGHTVRYFALAPKVTVWSGFASIQTTLIPRGNGIARLLTSSRLLDAIRAWKPDAIYYRFGHHVQGLPGLFHSIPTIAEINSDDLREYPLSFPLHKILYHRLTRSRLLCRVAGFVPVTVELGQRLESFRKPTLPLGNSITLSEYSISPVPANSGPRQLVFLGAPNTPWHGIERIGELAALLPNWRFEISGFTADDHRSIPSNCPREPNQTFHGYLGRERYKILIESATAALGTLALWKNKMDEACPLKVREYLACGLPVIAAYNDTDIPESADYFLRLPNDASPLAPHLPAIKSFLQRWEHQRVPRSSILHLDTRVKEAVRLEFIGDVAKSWRSRNAR